MQQQNARFGHAMVSIWSRVGLQRVDKDWDYRHRDWCAKLRIMQIYEGNCAGLQL
jgi:hypothetical protein